MWILWGWISDEYEIKWKRFKRGLNAVGDVLLQFQFIFPVTRFETRSSRDTASLCIID